MNYVIKVSQVANWDILVEAPDLESVRHEMGHLIDGMEYCAVLPTRLAQFDDPDIVYTISEDTTSDPTRFFGRVFPSLRSDREEDFVAEDTTALLFEIVTKILEGKDVSNVEVDNDWLERSIELLENIGYGVKKSEGN